MKQWCSGGLSMHDLKLGRKGAELANYIESLMQLLGRTDTYAASVAPLVEEECSSPPSTAEGVFAHQCGENQDSR